MGKLTALDYIVVAAYVIASLVVGLWQTRKQSSVESYFVADRSAKSWVVVVSAIASHLSAISFLGVPAWVFAHDLQLNAVVIILPFTMIAVVYLFVPLMARLKLLTIYEYLEARFNVTVRTLASLMFLLLRGGWLASAIYTQSLLLAELLGMPMLLAVVTVGGLTASYTIMGGMKAVLWTDVMQFFVLIGGLLAMVASILLAFHGHAGTIWHLAAAGGHTRIINTRFSLVQISVYAVVLGNIAENLFTYGSDQVMVQRFLASRSTAEMRRSVMFTGLVTVPIVLLLAMLGLGLVAYYEMHPNLRANLTNVDRVVPHFISNVLPTGIAGLVIAGVFAATMSTLSAGFNSLATATFADFFKRFRQNEPANPRSDVTLARWITFGWAAMSTFTALFVNKLGSIIEIFGKINGFFCGPILGVFLLGILTHRPGGTAAVIGMLTGAACTAYIVLFTNISWLWYSPFGAISTFLIGYLAGQLLPARKASLEMVTSSGHSFVG